MGSLLDKAILAARKLPAEEQDEIARLVLAIVGEEAPTVSLSRDEEASLEASLGQAAVDEFATDADVAEIWRKHGF